LAEIAEVECPAEDTPYFEALSTRNKATPLYDNRHPALSAHGRFVGTMLAAN
jgi:hypothetical protein